MEVVPVEYGTFTQRFHLMMWLFQFITGIYFKWDYEISQSVALLVWIGIWINGPILDRKIGPLRPLTDLS